MAGADLVPQVVPGEDRCIAPVRPSTVSAPRPGRTPRSYDPPQDLFRDPDAMLRLCDRAPETFRALIRSDASAEDLVVNRLRQLPAVPDWFELEAADRGGRERVWQDFLEANPWILGVSLARPLVTSCDADKLEKVVAGFSVAGPGKRAERPAPDQRAHPSMVFAEIKHHQTPLLAREYRPGCWSPSHLPGASALVPDHRPPRRAGGVHRGRYQSIELYRRNLDEPEVITLDELLARAEWHVTG
ncbi:Shedu anti-phage system protein SduA domain-containing protein [Amycolatopsis thermophila]|uniref:Shedu protein SduA C-terminal domain-containing protein n=1 Tax=Amycolatopsis thermophila TaxID=206084 RepID=A0ABU0F349_9PSEU|nr:Shedu anti-phage system protein SduA domain-containing protein [Amycolatopsis thermophila]MDQ0382008.1 hypothetical protein [Amycolatopsis thermophila]